MTANFLYAAFRAAVGIRYRSVWFVSMAIYYLLLGAIRLSLISGGRGIFLSGICHLPVGHVYLLHDDLLNRPARASPQTGQSDSARGGNGAFCRRADVGSPVIAQFSTESDGFRQSMNAMTGGVIWLAVILLAACMLCRSRKKEDSP